MQRYRARIRPGVEFPDWSAVVSSQVEQALSAIFRAFGVEKTWTGYGETEDRIRRAILDSYLQDARAPSLAALSSRSGLVPEALRRALHSLRTRDLVTLSGDGAVTGAYPLTDRETGHRVELGGRSINAMCAIDALGTGAMYGRDAVVRSSCRHCGESITVETGAAGTKIAGFTPPSAVVWSGIRYADNSAATSLCTVIAFFCSDRHLEAWREANHPDTEGYRLTVEEGRQAGAAIFGPMLARRDSDTKAA